MRAVKHVEDVDGLHEILGNTIIAFMRVKPQPFLKNALVSQDRFFEVPTYKRAMTFVFLARYVLGFKSQNQWKKFTEQDLKFNQRSFNRWCDKDYDLINNCSEFKKLPDVPTEKPELPIKRKVLSGFSSNSPVKRTYVVNADSTDED